MIANNFNIYFISVADSIISSVRSGTNGHGNKPNPIQCLLITLNIHSQISNAFILQRVE